MMPKWFYLSMLLLSIVEIISLPITVTMDRYRIYEDSDGFFGQIAGGTIISWLIVLVSAGLGLSGHVRAYEGMLFPLAMVGIAAAFTIGFALIPAFIGLGMSIIAPVYAVVCLFGNHKDKPKQTRGRVIGVGFYFKNKDES